MRRLTAMILHNYWKKQYWRIPEISKTDLRRYAQSGTAKVSDN
jgi:hypothetical protein